jgi:hypothetical protein
MRESAEAARSWIQSHAAELGLEGDPFSRFDLHVHVPQGAVPEQAAFVLARPREALAQSRGVSPALRDPRLSGAANWLAKHLTQALETLTRVENWLRTPNERELRGMDREIVRPLLERVGDQASLVAELVLGPDLKREKRG